MFYIITVMPKRVDLEAKRHLITHAAIAVINESGLEGARLRDVARAAKVTTGSVMHYFDGKAAVLEAALQEIVRRTLARMETGGELKPTRDVGVFVSQACTFLPLDREGREEWRVWLAFWGRAIVDARLRAVHRGYYERIVEALVEPLKALRSVFSPLSDLEVRRCADAVIAGIDGVGTRATLEPEHWPPERQLKTLRELLRPMLVAFVEKNEPGVEGNQLPKKEKKR